jgi:hypothetical protein
LRGHRRREGQKNPSQQVLERARAGQAACALSREQLDPSDPAERGRAWTAAETTDFQITQARLRRELGVAASMRPMATCRMIRGVTLAGAADTP